MKVRNTTNKIISFPSLRFSIGKKEVKEVDNSISGRVLTNPAIEEVKKIEVKEKRIIRPDVKKEIKSRLHYVK